MKNPKRFLIILLVGAIFVCSVVWILSESRSVHTVSEVFQHHESTGPEILSPLTSHEEAIYLANEFLVSNFGNEFFETHFKVLEIDERPELRSLWFVKYQYSCNGYTVNLSVAIDIGPISKGTSRVVVDFSNILLNPQDILISEEQARIIAQAEGLGPSYTISLSCELRYHRICWRIEKENTENLKRGDLVGLLIDAESGKVLETWEKGI